MIGEDELDAGQRDDNDSFYLLVALIGVFVIFGLAAAIYYVYMRNKSIKEVLE